MSISQKEGRAADWVSRGVLAGDASSAADFLGETSPDGWTVTEEMVAYVQEFIDRVQQLRDEIGAIQISPEFKCEIPEIGRFRIDANIAGSPETIAIADMKYGWRIIEPYHNMQLLLYACALLTDQTQHARLIIFQPRPYHPSGPWREWHLAAAELRSWREWLIMRATATRNPDAAARPGPHCDHCPAAATCPALAEATYRDFDMVTAALSGRPLSGAEISRELHFLSRAARLVEARTKAVRAEAEARSATDGLYIPGFARVEKYARERIFTVSPGQIAFETGKSTTHIVDKTPSDLKKEGVPKSILDKITARPIIGHELREITEAEIARKFGK